jgi:hypothetical protein
MSRGRAGMRVLVLVSGIGLAWSMMHPASAQFECPPGQYYVPGWACQLPNTPYTVPDDDPDYYGYYYYPAPIQQFHRRHGDYRDDRRGTFGHDGFGRGDSGRGTGLDHH